MLAIFKVRLKSPVLLFGLGMLMVWGKGQSSVLPALWADEPRSSAQPEVADDTEPSVANQPVAATGTLRLTFRYAGNVPPPQPIKVGIARPCAEAVLFDERLLVDPVTKGIQNLVVYLDTSRTGTKLPPVIPRKEIVQLAYQGCRFDPRIVLLQVGDTLRVSNQDPIGHNVNFSFFGNGARNSAIPAGGQTEFEIKVKEPTAIPVSCNIHPWIKAWVLALDHPFAGVSDQSGRVEIAGLPTGRELKFRVYHEFLDLETVLIGGQPIKLKRRRITRPILPGLNNFGTITVPGQPPPR